MKKTNNKGFSLVELIVVIAIMAVLMVVVVPQFLRYVDKARQQRDDSAAAEVLNAVEIAMADETINSKVATGATVTVVDGNQVTSSVTEMQTELQLVFPEAIDFTSNARDTKTYTITITKDATTSTVTFAEAWN